MTKSLSDRTPLLISRQSEMIRETRFVGSRKFSGECECGGIDIYTNHIERSYLRHFYNPAIPAFRAFLRIFPISGFLWEMHI